MARQFKHDCEKCVYLGNEYKRYDMYFCPDDNGGIIVIRYGNEPSENTSADLSIAVQYMIQENYHNAIKAGLRKGIITPEMLVRAVKGEI